MAIKKYTSGAWVPITYHKYGTETEIITSLPAQIIGDGQPITSCQISGNMVQNSTPTPSDPIYPEECGDLETMGEHAGQYKLPISCGGTTTNVYLGEQSATRRIKKLVLTGYENVTDLGEFYNCGVSINSIAWKTISSITGGFITSNNGRAVWATKSHFSEFEKAADFKSYLAAQYAAGTPVTVWYVLATPETGIVNEPIRKIGDYADTVVATNIPTTGTPENFDVGTTLKPSEVQLTYHGWHEHTDTKYTQGE